MVHVLAPRLTSLQETMRSLAGSPELSHRVAASAMPFAAWRERLEAALVEASKAGNATRSQRLMGCSWVIGDATDANDDPLSNGITALEDDLDSHSMVNLHRMLTLATDLTPPVADSRPLATFMAATVFTNGHKSGDAKRAKRP